ncbi:NAD-dependent epimerase/dehydratase family protein [Wenyingzhuangia sp. IMCC45574]
MGIELKNKRVLVVGGNGYLGSFLVNALHKEKAIAYIASIDCKTEGQFYQLDITNLEATRKVVQEIKPDVIYHLAASISRNRDFSIFNGMSKVNVEGTLNVLKAIENLDTHFIFTSTSEVYGNNESPFHEDQFPKPVSPYSLTKYQAESLINTYCTNHQKKHTILRVFNFYGEGMPVSFFIPQMIQTLKKGEDFLMTKGEQVRDFLYVDDVVNAMLLSAGKEKAYGQVLNVCSGEGTQLAELALEVQTNLQTNAKIVLGAIPYRDSEVWEMIGDNKKIKDCIGFSPNVSLAEGMRRVIENT